ncbi:MAG: putative Ig domain-containing protein [Methylotenera sp.]|nr:putative Ig domain-containing protein [Methylotenera sp.]MDD4927013.1 putative Ig domain-containing protein [Methylotenera sp.]
MSTLLGEVQDNISVSWDETVLNWQGDEYNMYSSAVSRRGEVVPEIKSLYISWGNGNGVKVGVPDMNDNTLADLIASGENWGLGWGIEQFKFADGTVLSMQEMIDLASPAQPVFEPLITFNLGSGNVTVSYVGPEKYVQMDFNSSKADFILTQDGNDLLLTHVNGFDQLRIQNRNQDTLSVFFKDGGYQLHGNNQLVNYGFNGDDIISSVDGFNNTSLIGQGGNDAIYGDSSNQTLIGGSGNDQLYGGAGSDLYMVDYGNGQNVVHGHDVIYETEQNSDDIDVVSIAAPVDSISLARNQEDLVISYGQYGDTITLAGWYAANGNAIEFLNFTDDTSWGKSTLVAMAPVAGAVNHAPLVMAAITLQTATEDALFSFTAPANAFSDEDAGDTLSYNTTLLDGSALPSWLSFDKSTLTFSGTPGNDHVGNISLTLTVTDLANASASQNFDLNVINSNDVPIVVNTIANTQVTDGSVFNWTLPTNIFIDVDQGDQLSYTLSQADGGALPNWLSYDAQTQTLSGTPSASDIGDLNIKVTAMDSGGAIAETGFNLNINAMPAQEVTGGNINDTIIGGSGNDELDGGAGNDIINGGYGDDALTGGTGSDLLLGGEGNDTFLLSADGTWVSGYGVMNAGSLGHAGSNQFISITGRIASADAMDGGPGYDVLLGTSGNDIIVLDDGFTASPNGYQPRFNSIEAIRAGDGDDIIDMTSSTFAYGNVALEGNAGNDVLWASSGDDLLDGGIGNDRLDGGWGNDILLGGDGNDTLFDRYRHNLLDGGTGNDVITAGSGRDIIIGGQGDDIITIGTGYDVIVFNKGDGQDTISAPTGADNTISLGGNFAYSDLSLTKSTNNLILKVGVTDQITLKDWYLGSTNKSVINLQVIAEAVTNFALGGTDALRNNKVENFNFANLVTAFDADVATNAANATNWQLTDARLTAHLQAGSDTAAIGGDLAYQYGRNSNLTGMGLANAQSVIAAASFGQTAQTLNNPSVWQAEVVKLG